MVKEENFNIFKSNVNPHLGIYTDVFTMLCYVMLCYVMFKKYKTFSVLIYSYINTSGN